MRIAVAGATGMVGMRFVRAATEAGLEVRGMSPSQGVDLFSGIGVHEALDGADAVVDVVQSPSLDEVSATHFFRRVAVILGRAAQQAGVGRSVVVSVIGCDRLGDPRDDSFGLEGYYRAKFAHEEATREEAPQPHVLRSAQLFHFVGQEVARGRTEFGTTLVHDLPIQPVALDEVVSALLDLATGVDERPMVQVAGPQRERLGDLALRFTTYHRAGTEVVTLPVGPDLDAGLLLPRHGVDITGPTFAQWLAEQPVCAAEE